MTRDEPFGVYVHWPFCKAKCPYCDFNSHVRHGGIDEARFLAAYLTELKYFAGRAPGRTVSSIFFGGGTPSLMQPRTVAAILDGIARHWAVADDAEITLEANPTSVEAENFAGYAAAGVNRLSLGVQALDDSSLKALGRRHTVDEALAALDLAKQNFGRVSFDLIYAREGQTIRDWQGELTRALTHAADHLSLYQLTIEDGTPFAARHAAGRLSVPDGDIASAMYLLTQELCEKAGLAGLRDLEPRAAGIGIASQPRLLAGPRLCRHRRRRPCRITEGGAKRALSTIKSPEAWLAQVEAEGHGLAGDESLSTQEAAEEYLLMALRLAEGMDLARFAALSGHAIDEAQLHGLEGDGLVARNGSRLVATRSGRLVLERLILELAA